jgi:hypothetical protein
VQRSETVVDDNTASETLPELQTDRRWRPNRTIRKPNRRYGKGAGAGGDDDSISM